MDTINVKFPGNYFNNPMNAIFVECLRDEGLNARLFGPRPHGFGISVQEGELTYRLVVDKIDGIVYIGKDETNGKHSKNAYNGRSDVTFEDNIHFLLADPECFKKIKKYIKQCSTKPLKQS